MLLRGIGGGTDSGEAVAPDNAALFTGGGGGFFFPRTPNSGPPFAFPSVVLSLISICGLAGSRLCVVAIPPKAPTLSAIPYLLFNLFAV